MKSGVASLAWFHGTMSTTSADHGKDTSNREELTGKCQLVCVPLSTSARQSLSHHSFRCQDRKNNKDVQDCIRCQCTILPRTPTDMTNRNSKNEIERLRKIWLTRKAQRDARAYEAFIEYAQAAEGDDITLPASPIYSKERHLPAHKRLENLQLRRKETHSKQCPGVPPLYLVPNRPVRNPRRSRKDVLYGQAYKIFTLRLLAWAMKEDPEATEELFSVVKPFALVIQLDRLADPDWHKAIPAPAKAKIIQLCIVENRPDQLKDFQNCLRSTSALSNLEVVKFYSVPKLVSSNGTMTRKLTHEQAVKYGMDPEVRLFFRWALADDTRVSSSRRNRCVKNVTEVLRESRPAAAGGDPPARYTDATGEYSNKTWETFPAALLRPWLPKVSDA